MLPHAHIRLFGLAMLWLLLPAQLIAQGKENYNWLFGNYAGLSFATEPPSVRYGAVHTQEGCASISDTAGNLLFYTDGTSVYDRLHRMMPNGNFLTGNGSSTQSAVIVPMPNSNHLYYIFTVDWEVGQKGLRYSVVDMDLDSGRGDILSNKKNVLLVAPTAEKIVAVKQRNCHDIWIIAHGRHNNVFYLYELTPSGISGKVQHFAEGQREYSDRGYMRISHDGTKIALAAGFVELFSFDNKTGQIRFLHKFDKPGENYGLEFSPNDSFLYAADRKFGNLYQFNLNNYSETRIAEQVPLGALQLGPDGKIYISQYLTASLGLIKQPDLPAPDCDYEESAISVYPFSCQEGLPTFIGACPPLRASFTYTDTCFGEAVHFMAQSSLEPSHYLWSFDSHDSLPDTSTLQNPVYTFDKPGMHWVRLTVRADSLICIIQKAIPILTMPRHAPQTLYRLCRGSSLLLNAGNPGMQHFWQNGDTSQLISVNKAGKYIVQSHNGSCSISDTFEVQMKDTVWVSLGRDSTYCMGKEIRLDAGPGADSYTWSTGDTGQSIIVKEAGTYWVLKEREQCTATDSIRIRYYPMPPEVRIDTSLCAEGHDSLLLRAGVGSGYDWQPGALHGASLLVSQPGDYVVNFSDPDGCPEAWRYRVSEKCPASFYMPNAFRPGGPNAGNILFKPVGLHVSNFRMEIYDRWGELLYSTQDMSQGWDGSFQGAPCPEGVYLYVVRYSADENHSLSNHYQSGTVMLLR